jgi:4-hydroxyphenylpyruvate dioxygenase-like putative hemolysin
MTEQQAMKRDRLPNRRNVESIEFAAGIPGKEIAYMASLGFYPDGRLGEIFLSSGRSGTDLVVSTYETAVAASFALQFGCPVEEMARAMPRTSDGMPEGPLGTLLDRLIATKSE